MPTQLQRIATGYAFGEPEAGSVPFNQDSGDDFAFIPVMPEDPQIITIASLAIANSAVTPLKVQLDMAYEHACGDEPASVCYIITDKTITVAEQLRRMAETFNLSGYFGGGYWTATATVLTYTGYTPGQNFIPTLTLPDGVTATLTNTPSEEDLDPIPAGVAVVNLPGITQGVTLPGNQAGEQFVGITLQSCAPIRVGCRNSCETDQCDRCLRVRTSGPITVDLEVAYEPSEDTPPNVYMRQLPNGAFTQRGALRLAPAGESITGMVALPQQIRILDIYESMKKVKLQLL